MSKPLAISALVLALLAPVAAGAAGADERPVVLLTLADAVGPATSDYIARGVTGAAEQGAELVVLRMDTPGGLDTSMREIIRAILASPVPVAVYVSPSGARAASAGTYILYASHVAAMAPGTNLGAATPVQLGGLPGSAPKKPEDDAGGAEKSDEEAKGAEKPEAENGGEPSKAGPKPTMADKAVNDAAAYIRSLAQMRGRNADWAVKAVREAASLAAKDALQAGVIDVMADDLDELLAKIHGRTVTLADGARTLATREARVVVLDPDWRTELLAVITNPNIAYILMLIGIYGLIFEFSHPGAVVPGVVGAISLLLAFFALHVLPINFAGLALILLGIALMVGEVFAPSFGALGLGGVAAFAIGSVILFETDQADFSIAWPVIATVTATSAGFFLIVVAMALKARRRPVVSGHEEMIGEAGRVIEWSGDEGRVRAHGEVWGASAQVPLEPGQRVRVAAIHGLTLVVEPQPDGGNQWPWLAPSRPTCSRF
jgi:membrane-bound serine protease (ClpP class)